MYDLKNRTALVTGGAKRIGRAICLGLAQSGANVVVHYNTSASAADALIDELASFDVKAWKLNWDLSSRVETQEAMARVNGLAGPVDILVNSASIFPKNRITEFSGEDLDLNIQVNAFAPLLLSRAFADQASNGVIINLLDSRITGTDDAHAAYHLSKRMLYAMTRILALELAPSIRVGGVAPGLVLPPPGEDETYLEKNKHTLPLKRFGDADSVVAAVDFLIRSDFITGQIIFVDGGRHVRSALYGY
ncbi:MAG: SDR family oxidoreductase [Myxococcota bacterium]|nr:SDR family oxidoreductase [Myxococcota bacterium]